MKKLRVMVTVPLSFRLLSRLYMAFEAFNVGRSGVARSLLGTRFRGSTLEPYVDGFRFRESFFTCFIDAELLQVRRQARRQAEEHRHQQVTMKPGTQDALLEAGGTEGAWIVSCASPCLSQNGYGVRFCVGWWSPEVGKP